MRSLLYISIAMGRSCLCSCLSIGSRWMGGPWAWVGWSPILGRQGLDQGLGACLLAWLGSPVALEWSNCPTGPGILSGIDPCLGWKSINYQRYFWSCKSIRYWNRCRSNRYRSNRYRSNRCSCRYSGQVQERRDLRVKSNFSE